MKKTLQLVLLLSILVLVLSACKKNHETTPGKMHLLNGTASMDKYLKSMG